MMNCHCVYMFSQLLDGFRGRCSQMNMKESSYFLAISIKGILKPGCCWSSNIVTVFLILCAFQPVSLHKGEFWGLVNIFHKVLFPLCLQEAMDLEAGQPCTQNVLRRTNHLWTLQMSKLWFQRSTRSWCLTSSTLRPLTRQPWKTLEKQVCIMEFCCAFYSVNHIRNTKIMIPKCEIQMTISRQCAMRRYKFYLSV